MTTPLRHATRAAYTRSDDGSIPFEQVAANRRAYWEALTQQAVTTALDHAGLPELFAYVHRARLEADGWWTCGCGEQLTQVDAELRDTERDHYEQVVREAVLGDSTATRQVPVPKCPRCGSADVVVHQLAAANGVYPAGIDCRACGRTGMTSSEDQAAANVVSDLVYALVDAGVTKGPVDEPAVMRLAGSPVDAAQVAQWLRDAHQAGREAGRLECQDEHAD